MPTAPVPLPPAEIIAAMRVIAPPGQARPDAGTLAALRGLTRELVAATPGAADEHARFLAIRDRQLPVPEDALTTRLNGAVILVTGGTGCIGSALMTQLAAYRPARLVSVSRGTAYGYPRVPWAWYRENTDIRDRVLLDDLLRLIQPDIVFHVAAQRDPGLAETEVHRTVTTNVLGTRNVLAAATEAGVAQVVCASTGKALRPYSPDIYTASKRAAEWVTSQADWPVRVSAGRFTHVADNSIIYRRLHEWAAGRDGGAVRLHSDRIAFYVQSAAESAQLLLAALLGGARGQYRVNAISDLGWPVGLLDLALGVLADTGSEAPVYFSGYDRGYEEIPFPGLYDPATAVDVSPLLNAFEAAAVVDSPCPGVDAFRADMAPGPGADGLLATLERVCGWTENPDAVRGALDDLSWALLNGTLRAAPRQALERAAALARRHGGSLDTGHRRVLRAIEDHAADEILDLTRLDEILARRRLFRYRLGDWACRTCDHDRAGHQHFRPGSDCGWCECRRWRPTLWPRRRYRW